jgi:hypothetical protein
MRGTQRRDIMVFYSQYANDWYVRLNGQIVARFSNESAAWGYLRLVKRCG